jgi:hypothetical protein
LGSIRGPHRHRDLIAIRSGPDRDLSSPRFTDANGSGETAKNAENAEWFLENSLSANSVILRFLPVRIRRGRPPELQLHNGAATQCALIGD